MLVNVQKILTNALTDGRWRQVAPNTLRRCLGEDLDDLKLFETLEVMLQMSANLDRAGYVDDPEFCMTRQFDREADDLRLEFPRALIIAGSIIPGDDVFVAIRTSNSEDIDPSVLVFDWTKSVPSRWTERGKLSELIHAINS